ncbi:MAG: hypothetical protein A2287_02795 [Candidatus Melainabacteria bacterium RIFOXYA12_FULL_32_12]|nr:MAG: hypothetical protein A2287_02795 [Candidatus Melainabacteria bacterium RIFOXYA12_FULL_32_12]
MAKYKIKGTNILYNGKLYAEDKTIELPDNEALQLSAYLEIIPEKSNKKQDEQNKAPKENPKKNSEEVNGGNE